MMVLELRQYTLRRGRREELIELFEREFVAPQNAVGAQVMGTFRDLDDPDRFVWLRSFRDMESRPAALADFYDGPVWAAHRAAANATMIDSDNVLLLKALADPDPSMSVLTRHSNAPGVLRLAVHYLGGAEPMRFAHFFEAHYVPRIKLHGVPLVARFITDTSPNNFARLPVREGEMLFAWLVRLDSVAAEGAFSLALAADSGWRDTACEEILRVLMRKPEVLRLTPTDTSMLR